MKRLLGISILCMLISMTACEFAKDVATTEPIAITVDELAEKFKADEDSAEKECRNTVYEITGVIEDFAHTSSMGWVKVKTNTIYEGEEEFNLKFSFDERYIDSLPEVLEEGDTITIKARYEDYYGGGIDLADAIYVSHETREKYVIPQNSEYEHGTTEYVDFLVFAAKEDSEAAEKYQLQDAVEWLRDNADNCFDSQENMEKTMYFGALLEYRYKEESTKQKYADAGWQAVKTVKYVYRGVEKTTDEVTIDNYKELIELAKELRDIY